MSYPTSLDDSTSLNTTRATGDTIPASDHNNLGTAVISLETKVGSGASVPTTTGHVLKVTGAGATAFGTLPTHTHAESDTTSLVSDLAGKASATHSHAESDVTSLTTDLAGKQAHSTKLDNFAGLTDAAGTLTNDGSGALSWASGGGGGGGGGGMWTLVTSGTSTTIDITGLDGDAAHEYKIIFEATSTSTNSFYLTLNNDTSGIYDVIMELNGWANGTAVRDQINNYDTSSYIYLNAYQPAKHINSEITLSCLSGYNRMGRLETVATTPGATYPDIQHYSGAFLWRNTANVTEIKLFGDFAFSSARYAIYKSSN